MFTREFWLGENGAFVRSIRTAAQTAIATIGVGQTNLFSADIKNIAALSVSAAILSLLMSLDRREALLTPVPGTVPDVVVDPQPVYAPFTAGCGGDLR
jgi:hypothetical protein